MNRFKAVLFDMDGIIVDTMPYHFISWFDVLKRYGLRISPMTIFEMEGARWNKVIRFAAKQSGKKISAETEIQIRRQREQIFKKYFHRYIFDGIEDFIKSFKNQSILTAIVTGSSLNEVRKFLPKNIYNLFDTIITGDDFKRGKPFPQPYLTAAKKLKVKPKECCVIENAPYGIRSAKAAKMYCIAIETSLPKEYLKEADIIYSNHKEMYDKRQLLTVNG